MKKRFLAIFCVLTILLCLLAATVSAADSGKIYVGYAKTDINPWVDPTDHSKGVSAIPLAGYSTPYRRLAMGRMDDNGDGKVDDNDGMFATCTAIKDGNGKLLIFLSYDMISAEDTTVSKVRTMIVDALGDSYDITPDQIMISASHSHYSPNLSYSGTSYVTNGQITEATRAAVAAYRTYLYDQMTLAATEAVANLKEVKTITKSTTDAGNVTGYYMNTVRHYKLVATKDASTVNYYAGDNFGSNTYAGTTYGSSHATMAGYKVTSATQVTQANDQMHLLKFAFKDTTVKPVVLINWRAHTTMNRSYQGGDSNLIKLNPGLTLSDVPAGSNPVGYYCVSASYVNALRYQLEQLGYRPSFIQGAAGNINANSRASNLNGWVDNAWMVAKANAAGFKTVNSDKTVRSKGLDEYQAGVIIGNVYAELLAQVAKEGLKSANMTTCTIGNIETMQMRYAAQPHCFDNLMPGLQYAAEAYQAERNAYLNGETTSAPAVPYVYNHTDGKKYIINSEFHANTVVSRAKALVNGFSESSGKLELNAIMIGPNLAFVSAPNELYDFYDAAGSTTASANDWLLLNSDNLGGSYGTPFVMAYSNGAHGYLPNTLAFRYNKGSSRFGQGAYGANTAQISEGDGEVVIAAFGKMLKTLNGIGNNTIKTAKCEHCKTNVQWKPLFAENDGTINLYHDHYYLAEDIDGQLSRQKNILAGQKICIDLNGHTIHSNDKGIPRVFYVPENAELTILDTVGTGKVLGNGGKDLLREDGSVYHHSGGVICVEDKSANAETGIDLPAGVVNIYGGTIQKLDTEGLAIEYGGSVYCSGIVNMYGGTIVGSKVTHLGGALHCNSLGRFNMYGGTIQGGTNGDGTANSVNMYNNFKMYGGTIQGGVKLGGSTGHYITGKSIIDGSTGKNLDLTSNRKISVGTLESGSSISVTASGIFTDANGASANNAQYFKGDTGCYVSPTPGGMFAGDKWYCPCGGTKPAGHTCQNVAWKSWTSTTTIPTSNGNYYLTKDVTTNEQIWISDGKLIGIDLNGHNITYKLPVYSETPLQGDKPQTRLIYIYQNADMVITDTTKTPGTISRDLSNWTDEEIATIDNWGTLLMIHGNKDGTNVPASVTMYNGILDGTKAGSVANGYGLVSVHNDQSTFKMYGGEIRGGACRGAGAISNGGTLEIYGGKVVAGSSSGSYSSCVHISAGSVLLSGNPQIDEIYFTKPTSYTNGYTDVLTVKDTFTGNVNLRYAKEVSLGQDVGTSVNADVSGGLIAIGEHMCVDASGDDLVVYEYRYMCQCGNTKPAQHNCSIYDWKPWVKTDSLPKSGNYYLVNNVVTSAQTGVAAYTTVRIDLNSKNITYKVPQTLANSTRVFSMANASSNLVITDSTTQPGTVTRDVSGLTAAQISAISNWGMIALINNETAVFSLYNGVLDSDGGVSTGGGGAISIHKSGATFNMYGGTVKGADVGSGGAVYIAGGANANLYGGTITGGSASTANRGDCVHVQDTATVRLAGNASVQELYFVGSDNSSNLVIKGVYSGGAALNYMSGVTEGKIIGVGESANISGATLTCVNNAIMDVTLSGNQLKLSAISTDTVAVVYDNSGMPTSKHTNLQDAITASTDTATVVMQKNYNHEINVPAGKVVQLDLNGFDISSAKINGTVYVKDSATDSFDTAEGGYGKISVDAASSLNLKGMPVDSKGVAYVKVVEDDGVSFHCLKMHIGSAGVYYRNPGMEYVCDFKGDKWAAAQVEAYGVAVSTVEEPSLVNGEFASHCAATQMTNFASGSNGNSGNSSAVTGILKDSYSHNVNMSNANMLIYGRSYVKLADGTCLLGTTRNYSLRDLYEYASDGTDSAGNSIWDNYLNENGRKNLIKIYDNFNAIMDDWKITKLIADRAARIQVEEDSTLKILAIGNSHSNDATQMLYKIFADNKVNGKFAGKYDNLVIGRLYYSGCSLAQHASFAKKNSAVYDYYKNESGTWVHQSNFTMLNALQDEQWDYVTMQEGSSIITTADSYDNTNLQYVIRYVKNYTEVDPQFLYNFTWTHPTDEIYLAYDPETNVATGKGHPTNPAGWYERYQNNFGLDQEYMYEVVSSVTKNFIMTEDHPFVDLIPSGTAIQYAKFEMDIPSEQLYRDYTHLNDFGRTLIACLWYAKFADLDNINDITIMDTIPSTLHHNKSEYPSDLKITPEMKQIIKQAVNYALANDYLEK